jgi:acetyltransferase-like isoleucine patch superfamily enzyme/acyl carrier protein
MSDLAVSHGWSTRPALRRIQSLASEGLSRLALRGVDQVGARPRVAGFPFIENLGTITIGADFELLSGPIRSHLVTGVRGAIRIHDGVTIGSGAALAAESCIEIGDGARLGAQVMLLDTDYHVAGDGEARAAASPIVIGAHAWLGDRVTVLRGAAIGQHAHIEAGSVVSGIIPDGALAAGNPARVIQRGKGNGPGPGDAAEALSVRIRRIGAAVFALDRLPEPGDGPATIPAWDSLGALRLLISLEEELGLTLPAAALAGIRSFAGLGELCARAAERPPDKVGLP